MKTPIALTSIVALFAVSLLALSTAAGPLQPVSLIDASQNSPAGGGGDSWAPVISSDGRYVLFASTANNLVVNSNGNPIPALNPPKMNVYLRDRTNGSTTLISANLSGLGGGNGDSWPSAISTNGRYALFESSASDLVPGDTNNASDIFLRDISSNATFMVSATVSGAPGNGISRSSTMTPDARYVAFVSAATNLVAGDTNRISDIFVRDMQLGTTVLASAGAMSTNTASSVGSSELPDITPDGRYVAFFSTATNLVSGVRTIGDVYVRDLVSGTTTWASVDARLLLGTSNSFSFNHAISADGNFVAYETCTNVALGSTRGKILRYNVAAGTTDLVHTNANVPTAAFEEIRSLDMTPDGRFIAFVANTNGISGTNTCVNLWDAQSGGTTLVSVDLNNQVPAGTCDSPVIDPSGRYVAFLSSATNLVTNLLAGDYHLYVRDTQAGATKIVGVDTNGVGSSISPMTIPSLSDDGALVAFESFDDSLIASDRNRAFDVFVQDAPGNPAQLISAHHPGLPSMTPNGSSTISSLSVSANGRFVAFASEGDNLVANDTNGVRDVFARDRQLGTNILVSASTNGLPGDSVSTDSSISADGRFVAFTSSADNLVPGDTNKYSDVFLRDLQTSTTTLISVNSTGTGPGNNASTSPLLSSDARYVLFRSSASNLAPGASSSPDYMFFRDLQAGVTYLLGAGGSASTMTPDGKLVAFITNSALIVWNSQTASRIYTNSSAGVVVGLALQPGGTWLAYATVSQLVAVHLPTQTNFTVASLTFPSRSGLQFSADGRFLTYSAKPTTTGSNQVYLFDFQTRNNLAISDTPATGNSDSPAISADGHLIAYRSSGTNAVLGATNGLPQLFLYDRFTGLTSLLTQSRFGNFAADNRSLSPVFSGNGQALLFESWANDLAAADFNYNADLFAVSFLYASINASVIAGQGPTLSWLVAPQTSYRVEYKNSLSDSAWQDAGGTITIVDDQAQFTDPAPAGAQRFYRVVAF